MQILDADTVPGVDVVAAILEPIRADLAAHLRDADDAVITARGADSWRDVLGWASEHTTELVVVTAEWTWHTRTRGPRAQGAAVIQVGEGGRDAGEGWVRVGIAVDL